MRISSVIPLALLCAALAPNRAGAGESFGVTHAAIAAPAAASSAPERELLASLNRARAGRGLGPLVLERPLQAAASWMAADMRRLGRASHTDSLQRDPFARMDAFGYRATRRSEAVGSGDCAPTAMLRAWERSLSHRHIIYGIGIKAAGIGRACDSSGRCFWVADFGTTLNEPLPVRP